MQEKIRRSSRISILQKKSKEEEIKEEEKKTEEKKKKAENKTKKVKNKIKKTSRKTKNVILNINDTPILFKGELFDLTITTKNNPYGEKKIKFAKKYGISFPLDYYYNELYSMTDDDTIINI